MTYAPGRDAYVGPIAEFPPAGYGAGRLDPAVGREGQPGHVDVGGGPGRLGLKPAGILPPQGRGPRELADEHRHRWLAIHRPLGIGVDPLEVFIEPPQAFEAVVDPRQRPGVLGIVVRPGADERPFCGAAGKRC